MLTCCFPLLSWATQNNVTSNIMYLTKEVYILVKKFSDKWCTLQKSVQEKFGILNRSLLAIGRNISYQLIFKYCIMKNNSTTYFWNTELGRGFFPLFSDVCIGGKSISLSFFIPPLSPIHNNWNLEKMCTFLVWIESTKKIVTSNKYLGYDGKKRSIIRGVLVIWHNTNFLWWERKIMC